MKLGKGAVAVIVGAMLIATSACSSSGSKSSGSGSSGPATSTGASASGSGSSSGNKATGTPIKIGYIGDDAGANHSNANITVGVNAALDYINNELGGLNGHPIQLDQCKTDQTPENATQCGNKLAGDKPPFVLSGVGADADVYTGLLNQAGLPVIGMQPVSATEYTCSTCFMLSAGTVGVGGLVIRWAKANGITKINTIYVDIPAGKTAADNLFAVPGRKAGLTIKEIPLPPTAADATPAVAAALANDPGAIFVLHTPAACANVMKGLAAAGSKTKNFYVSSCASPTTTGPAGNAANGSYFNNDFLAPTETSDPDVALYVQKLNQYAPGNPLGTYSESGFGYVMTIYQIFKAANLTDLTTANVLATMKAVKGAKQFASGGATLTCDGKQFPGLAAICASPTAGHVVQYENGTFVKTNI
jgi:branched-chain amino acid transport system substrate-binding protein